MTQIQLNLELSYTVDAPGADFVFNIHPALTPAQTVTDEVLTLSQPVTPRLETDPHTHSRYLRLQAMPGELTLRYTARVGIHHHRADPWSIGEIPVGELPLDVVSYIYPSRYVPSDRLGRMALAQFGHLRRGYHRVQAIRDWVRNHVAFRSNTSTTSTTALDTLIDQAGVCRDFAHLMIALCRALNIPARFATGIDFGADPALGPTDFHAYVEVFLGGRWYIFDPSGTAIPMGFVRFGTGRDAADVSFATIFGSVQSQPPRISVQALQDAQGLCEMPRHRSEALSTDAPVHWG